MSAKFVVFALVFACASGCKGLALRKALRKGDLAQVQEASPSRRGHLPVKWALRYADLLQEHGRGPRASAWRLTTFLRSGDLRALEDLAVGEALQDAPGFAAAHFAEILATERGAIEDKALACRLWQARAHKWRTDQDWLALSREQTRIQVLCPTRFLIDAPNLDDLAQAALLRTRETPRLLSQLPVAMRPAFLDPHWRAHRLGLGDRAEDSQPAPLAPSPSDPTTGGDAPAQVLLAGLAGHSPKARQLRDWLSQPQRLSSPDAGIALDARVRQDLTLGREAAAWTALLAAGGHRHQLRVMQDKLRAATSLKTAGSAHYRVILALGLASLPHTQRGDLEASVFWMRLGASVMPDLSSWWIFCARWARLMQQRDAMMLALSSLAPLTKPGSEAALTVSWWRLSQRVWDFVSGPAPYLQDSAPNSVPRDSLVAMWQQYQQSLPEAARQALWPALVDELVDRRASDAQIQRVGELLLSAHEKKQIRSSVVVARVWSTRSYAPKDLGHQSPQIRRAAWRQLWSREGLSEASLARYWPQLTADPALSPQVDALATLSLLLPQAWGRGGLD